MLNPAMTPLVELLKLDEQSDFFDPAASHGTLMAWPLTAGNFWEPDRNTPVRVANQGGLPRSTHCNTLQAGAVLIRVGAPVGRSTGRAPTQAALQRRAA